MTLEEFAKLGGVRVERCHKEWGGTWAYKLEGEPNSTQCGYRTERELYKAWLEDSFGPVLAKAVLKLLKGAT
jgi:hypothetical protein